jgi:thioredoxin 1
MLRQSVSENRNAIVRCRVPACNNLAGRWTMRQEEDMVSEDVQTITDSNFRAEVLEDRGLVLVDFWAAWCGPCRRLGPTVDAVATDLRGSVKVGKLNVDENPETARDFNIRSIPTVMLFNQGRVIETIVGLVDRQQLTRVITGHLS